MLGLSACYMSAHPIVASVLGGAVNYKWVKENSGVLGPASICQSQRENSQPAAHDGSVMKDTHVQGLRGAWDGCPSISFRKDSAQQGLLTRKEVSRVEFPVGDTCKDQYSRAISPGQALSCSDSRPSHKEGDESRLQAQ